MGKQPNIIQHVFNISLFNDNPFLMNSDNYDGNDGNVNYFDYLALSLTSTNDHGNYNILAVGTICMKDASDGIDSVRKIEHEFYGCVKLYQYQNDDDDNNGDVGSGNWVELSLAIPADISGCVPYGGSLHLGQLSSMSLSNSSFKTNIDGDENKHESDKSGGMNDLVIVVGEPYHNRGKGRIVVHQVGIHTESSNHSISTVPAVSLSSSSKMTSTPSPDHNDDEDMDTNEYSWRPYGNTINEKDITQVTSSKDGSTIVISSSNYYLYKAPFVKTYKVVNDTTWIQRGQTLYGHYDNNIINDGFGSSTAISPDGNVLVVGASQWYYANNDNIEEYNFGYVGIYEWSSTNDEWVLMETISEDLDFVNGNHLIMSNTTTATPRMLMNSNYFGSSVALSNDGDKVYVYARDGDDKNSWNQFGIEIVVNSDESEDLLLQGVNVKISGEEDIMLIGLSFQRRGLIYQYENLF